MADLSFQPTFSTTFSGTFDAGRITKRRAQASRQRLIKHFLEFFGAIGIIALAASAFISWLDGHFLTFLVERHIINLIFWLSATTDLYLWAMLQEGQVGETDRDLLRSGHAQRWPKVGASNSHASADNIDSSVDIYELFAPSAQDIWDGSLEQAQKQGRQQPVVGDLLMSLLQHGDVKWLLLRFGIDAQEFGALVAAVSSSSVSSPAASFSSVALSGAAATHTASSDPVSIQPEPELGQVPKAALQEALKLHNRSIDPLMLLCGLLSVLPPKHPILAIFYKLNVTFEQIEIVAAWIFHIELFADDYKTFRRLSRFRRDSEINTGMTSVPTPYLDQFSDDLTWAAKHGHLPLTLGREEDLDKIFSLLSEGRPRLLIKGVVGTGRTTVIDELAYKMVTEDVPKLLQDKRLIKLELAAILGTRLPAEQVLIETLSEAERSGNIILVIEDIHQLKQAASSHGLSLLELLVNHLERSPLAVIATTTLEDYQNSLRTTGNFDSTFTAYELRQLTEQAIILASCLRVSILEQRTGTFFTYQAIAEAVKLSNDYSRGAGQPEKAIEVLTEAAQRIKGQSEEHRLVTPQIIQGVVSEQTHVPQGQFSQDEADKLLNLEVAIGEQIIGQTVAVKAVAEALRRARSGLASGSRPLASFLFVGPTGVGKTELAKTLARVYFGEEKFLLRLDMSEYQGSDGLEKLLGQPGSANLTPFVNHLKNYPFCLFLLDEFEKASSEVLNLFLQVLEDGRLTTTAGETLDLKHTIIIATSNAGTSDIQAGLQRYETLEQIKEKLFGEILGQYFKPELLNRFDGVILFTPLSSAEVEQVTRLQLADLAKTLTAKGISLQFTDALISDVATKAYDPLFGARPIRRYIQDHVENVVANLLLSQPPPRGTTVILDIDSGGIVVR